MPTAIDQSFGFADPATAKRAGVEVVMMYLSPDPAKNATPVKVLAYFRVAIAVFLGWEATAQRALLGYGAGLADGREAARQYLELIAGVVRLGGARPKNHPFIAPAYDFDTNPGQYAVLDQYARGFAAGLAGHFGLGAYGEADLLDHFHALGLLRGGGFGTYAWSSGRISAWDDLHQYDNNQYLGGAQVDFDQVRHPIRLGAWWPPGSQYDTDGSDLLEWIMALPGAPAGLTYQQLLSDATASVLAALKDHGIVRFVTEVAGLANNPDGSAAYHRVSTVVDDCLHRNGVHA